MLAKVLVAVEEQYRLYRELIAVTLEERRPNLEVWSCSTEEIEQYVQCLHPDMIICARQNPCEPGDQFAWVELSLEPDLASKTRVDGRSAERFILSPGDLLSIVDEVEELRRSGGNVTSDICS
jgi:hypothetical protein